MIPEDYVQIEAKILRDHGGLVFLATALGLVRHPGPVVQHSDGSALGRSSADTRRLPTRGFLVTCTEA